MTEGERRPVQNFSKRDLVVIVHTLEVTLGLYDTFIDGDAPMMIQEVGNEIGTEIRRLIRDAKRYEIDADEIEDRERTNG